MAPKLTERHIYLPPFTNMRVKLATQVFSHSVAAGTKTHFIHCLMEKFKIKPRVQNKPIAGINQLT